MTTFPVTASTLSASELGDFIREKYQLNENFDCRLFRTGINHTYFISDAQTKFVVRVYCYQWRTKTEIEQELALLNLLKSNNLSISYPIPDKDGKFIHEIKAPEGLRYVVLFSFAVGDKVRFMTPEMCFSIGMQIAKIHTITVNRKIDRINYNGDVLFKDSYERIKLFFSETSDEMRYLKGLSGKISEHFNEKNWPENQNGVVHLDIWYDNLSVQNETEINIFDFDNCGNGLLILDVGYFCKQLFFIEQDRNGYESKLRSFLDGYQKIRKLSAKEIALIPEAGAAIFMYYLGVQAQRFDWSNIFLTENYFKMFVGRIKNWLEYNGIQFS